MKPESLHALLIDRELGELSSETIELLDAWLAEHPETATEMRSIHRTLATTGAAVRQFPELARPEPNIIALPACRLRLMPLALAASILLLLGGTGWVAFRAGQDSAQRALAINQPQPAAVATASTGKDSGPWARYALASGPRGLMVVRRDSNP